MEFDHNGIGSDMGASARPVIEKALSDNGIEIRPGVSVIAVGSGGVSLSSGEQLEAATVVHAGVNVRAAVGGEVVDRLERAGYVGRFQSSAKFVLGKTVVEIG